MAENALMAENPLIPWHTLEADAALTKLQSGPDGLDPAEVERRRAEHGPNELPEGRKRSLLRMAFDQLADLMILVLLAAAVVAGVVGEPSDTFAIVLIVLLNAVIGFVQEYRAEKAMEALRQMAAPFARVRRGGAQQDVPSAELVPGDLVLLEAGNIVPADLRLVESARLSVAEAALTGESHPIEKALDVLDDPALSLGDRANMAWKGTMVAAGRGSGVVVAIGSQTELGRIAQLLDSADEVKTPLQKRLARFGGRLAVLVLVVCAGVFAAGLARGEPPALMFLTAVSLAVAAIPEALPAVVAISLALGASRMAKQNALVRRLPAVETLGSVTTICTDKTGTLTQNKMLAEAFWEPGEEQSPTVGLLEAMALVNDAVWDSAGALSGDPTETALVEAAQAHGQDPTALREALPRVAELPFDSTRMRMATVHAVDGGFRVLVKGAPEAVLPECGDAAESLAKAEELAAQGLRVLAFAERRLETLPEDLSTIERELSLLGLVGLMDPPREEAQGAVAECKAAGIVPVMITGDHPATARAIAVRLGILEEGGRVLNGTELAALNDEDFAAQVGEIRAFARVDPGQKIRIVRALQATGQFVAMTGDGVNDAPALKRADIGVSMGEGGTDVAREASHMVLLDDNFATIVLAVREGRRIFDNIRRFVLYTMSSNAGEILTISVAPFLGLPIPLLPIHILWINLLTDGLPGLALAAERAEPGVMSRPPRPPDESIFAGGLWQHIVWVGLVIAVLCLGVQAWAIRSGSDHAQSMVFTVLCLSQLGHVMAIRSDRESLLRIGVFTNKPLIAAVVGTALLQLATLYLPFLNPIFKTTPLPLSELLLCLGLSSVLFFLCELEKLLVRRGWLYQGRRAR